ncbi:carboxyltransferase domain-containing protein [uncultured Clostridium sp.]|uniref:carboxyltransferase domain-containing protein n=1 Tax=uncultured Clostridium sp. TaxID=59620 RepID=UPI0025E6BE92|nr:carboxyltransferase domain-containing protein [uncultured Clostridium sp.]
MKNKYDPILKKISKRKECPEIVFRQAGDGFLEVVYGNNEASSNKTIRDIILRSMRVVVINNIIKNNKEEGIIETVPGAESLLYEFDPLIIDINELIDFISEIELSLETINNEVIETRVINMPLAFNHSLIKKSIEKYVREINPEAKYCKNGSNLEYIAEYNGITVEELKRRFIDTEWFVSMVGFFPGLPYFYPLNPRSAITCPKYNPARTWTPEGAVDLADYCSTIFGVESSGGCQLVGRTIPIFQAHPVHKQFKNSPALFKPTDLIKFFETSEDEVDKIYKEVSQGKWDYMIEPKTFSVKQWVEEYDSKIEELKELQANQQNKKI